MDAYQSLTLEDILHVEEELSQYQDPMSYSMAEPLTIMDQPVQEYSPDGLTPGVIMHDFGLQQVNEDLDYSNFAKWIPRYSKPANPCEYCRSKHLDCWFTFANQSNCSACSALFRSCSFSAEPNPAGYMDTLHDVQEDVCQEAGALTGTKLLRSWDRTPLDNPGNYDDERPTRRSTGTRFSRENIKLLKNWVELNAHNPYPSETEKEELASLTNLSVGQISNWFANTRRRNKKKSTRGASPSIRSPTWPTNSEAIPIPPSKRGIVADGKTWDIMNPLERWKISPPENEPADVCAIVEAVNSSRLSSNNSSMSRSNSRHNLHSSASGSFSGHRAPSTTSLETGMSDSRKSSESFSNHSLTSSRSHGSRNSLHSFGSGQRKERRRRKRAIVPSRTAGLPEKRPFQCTFCTDTFRTKYDWMRHEKSLHLNLEKWICAPLGDTVTNPTTGQTECVYCNLENPSKEHLDTHSHDACNDENDVRGTFYRKDHLRQHLRLVHDCSMIKSMDVWKAEATYIKCRCGFCGAEFTTWNERCDHLAKHFREGATMKQWKGCRGFDSNVAAHVTNAMPPFLIAHESITPIPFSATNEATLLMGDHPGWINRLEPSKQEAAADLTEWNAAMACTGYLGSAPDECGITFSGMEGVILPNFSVPGFDFDPTKRAPKISTCWEILTVRLGMWVNEQMRAGIMPTDEMLQRQARWILYDSDDNWNQTAADNPEWLELFKKAHGLPSIATDSHVDFNEDLGTSNDLLLGDLSFEQLTFQDTTWDMSQAMTTTAEDLILPMTMAG